MTAYINVKIGKKEVVTDVILDFNEYCIHCNNRLKLAQIDLDNYRILITYTCKCGAAYQMLYNRAGQKQLRKGDNT